MTTETVKSKKILEKTIATVTFDNGNVTTFDSNWEDTQGGVGYDAGTWGVFGGFAMEVEKRVAEAQKTWKLPNATIRYERVTETVETVERTYRRSAFHRERVLEAEKQ